MTRFTQALFAGLLLTIAGFSFFSLPLGQRVEEEYGLALLFKLRGPRQPPAEAVIINIDSDLSRKLGLPADFSRWSRSVYAVLVNRLTLYGAKVIAFDVFFSANKDREGDRAFVDAIRRAGNVVLVDELRYTAIGSREQTTSSGKIEVESIAEPIVPLARTALALSPFPLPKIPVRVNQAWLFKSSSGDIPTLPAVVLQAATLGQYGALYKLLAKKAPGLTADIPAPGPRGITAAGLVGTMRTLREVFLQHPTLRHDLTSEIDGAAPAGEQVKSIRTQLALIDMYGGGDRTEIDFYGPPGSITTLSCYDILAPPEDPTGPIARQIRGKVIFIGASHSTWSNQRDGHYTVFSRPNGVDLSGVELAATVFSNLLERRSVHLLLPWASLLLIFFCALGSSLVSFLFTPPVAGASILAGGSLVLVAACQAFSFNGTWTPLVVPLFFIPCLAFAWANLSNYLVAYRERRNIGKALGLYLPEHAVKELANDLSFISKGNKKVYSTCLITDARDYTTLSEHLSPEDLSLLMKEYYRYIFREIKDTGGVVCNVIGDSMLAQWPSAGPEARHNAKACQAALQISHAVTRFNEANSATPLPTRIGLHSGYLLMDNIGAEDHFEYAPVGDIVNTVSRIEGLNKHFGTQILASENTLQGVAGVDRRELGSFLLSGKINPVTVFELPVQPGQVEEWNRLKEVFAEALTLFRAGRWEPALAEFEQCLVLHRDDGPSRFYKNLCASYRLSPPDSPWMGVVKVGK